MAKVIHFYARFEKISDIESTSTSLERTFSTGGSIVIAHGIKLDQVNVNMFLYLRENLGKVQLDHLIVEDPIEVEMRIIVHAE